VWYLISQLAKTHTITGFSLSHFLHLGPLSIIHPLGPIHQVQEIQCNLYPNNKFRLSFRGHNGLGHRSSSTDAQFQKQDVIRSESTRSGKYITRWLPHDVSAEVMQVRSPPTFSLCVLLQCPPSTSQIDHHVTHTLYYARSSHTLHTLTLIAHTTHTHAHRTHYTHSRSSHTLHLTHAHRTHYTPLTLFAHTTHTLTLLAHTTPHSC
jgi:hypothetical protein